MQPGRQRLLLLKTSQNINYNNNINNINNNNVNGVNSNSNGNNNNNNINNNNNNYNYREGEKQVNNKHIENHLESAGFEGQSQPAEEKRTESTLDDALKEIPVDQFGDLWQIITRISDTNAGSSGHLQETAYAGGGGTKRRQLPPNPTLAQVLGIAIE